MTRPMPTTWRRLPLDTAEYEWFSVFPLPRTCGSFRVLVHHRRHGDYVLTYVITEPGHDPLMLALERQRALMGEEQAEQLGKTNQVTLGELLHRFYLPRLFTAYGYDREPMAQALRSQLPVQLHHDAQRIMRRFLYKKYSVEMAADARRRAVKKPRVFRDLAKDVSHALYRLAHKVDTWLWRKPQ